MLIYLALFHIFIFCNNKFLFRKVKRPCMRENKNMQDRDIGNNIWPTKAKYDSCLYYVNAL